MFRFTSIACLVVLLQTSDSFAQNLQPTFDVYARLMRVVCLSGTASIANVQVVSNFEGDLQIRGYPTDGDPTGNNDIVVNAQSLDGDVEGALSVVSESLRVAENEEIRACMLEILPKFLELIKFDAQRHLERKAPTSSVSGLSPIVDEAVFNQLVPPAASTSMSTTDPAQSPNSREGLDQPERDEPSVRELQTKLFRSGFSPGVVDGVWGNNSRSALHDFQISSGMQPTDEITFSTVEALRAIEVHRVDEQNSGLCKAIEALMDTDKIVVFPTIGQSESAIALFNWLQDEATLAHLSFSENWYLKFEDAVGVVGYKDNNRLPAASSLASSLGGAWRVVDLSNTPPWRNPDERDFFIVVGASYEGTGSIMHGLTCR